MVTTATEFRALAISSTMVLVAVVVCWFPANGDSVPADPQPQCAQLCVYHSCRLLGIPVEMKDIMVRMPPDDEGNSFTQMQEVLTWIGLSSRGRMAGYEEVVRGPFPAIAHFPDHFVVVEEADDRKVRLQDGYGRRMTLTPDVFKSKWDGKLLEINVPADQALPAYVEKAQPGQPRLKFKTLVVDAGLIENPDLVEPVSFDFEVENQGFGPLEIGKIRTDCTCAVAAQPQEQLLPGDSAVVTIKYNAGRSRGAFKHTAYVTSNDPAFPVVALVIAGTTQQTFEFVPTHINFGPITAGGAHRARVFAHYKGDEPFEIISASTSDDRIKVSVSALSADLATELLPVPAKLIGKPRSDSYVLSFELSTDGIDEGELTGEVEITTTVKRFDVLKLRYSAEIVPCARTIPSTVFLGDASPGVPLQTTINVSLRNSAPCSVLSFKSPVEGLTCRFPDGQLHEVPLVFLYTPPEKPHGLDSEVTLEYVSLDAAEPMTITVPLYAYARPVDAN